MVSFETLYSEQAAFLYALCYRLEGDTDKAEQLYADVWKRAHESYPEKGEVAVVLARHLINSHRKLGRASRSGASGTPMEAALARLAPEYRLPLVLREFAGLSYPALASALDVPMPTVRARLARARALLRLGFLEGVDDELLSAYLDGQLEGREAHAVETLLRSDDAWRRRLQGMKADADVLRTLPAPSLSPATRDIVLRSVTERFPLGAERRRVPRYRRRWMLLAAFAVPCVLTLLYLQNPTLSSRLFLRGDLLVLRAGRSGQKTPLPRSKEWKSLHLWGVRAPGTPLLSFQVDAGPIAERTLEASVRYDFDGDLKEDRVELYEPVHLDGKAGWQRFQPVLSSAQGELQDFRGGTVVLRLETRDKKASPLDLSGTPGELVLPYRQLRGHP
jgi:DNA-directed RNA polymerase specialized sigma24 family protein